MKVILETPRLVLRELTPADVDFVASLVQDDETMRFYPQRYTRADAIAWIQRNLERYDRDGHGLWLVQAKDTSQPVGQVGLVRFLVEGVPMSEIGYLIHRSFWRQGYATEAALGVRDHAFHVRNEPFVMAQIRPINTPSQGVARKLGMRPGKLFLNAGLEHVLWRVDRNQVNA
ncbi:MAG: GNAT family N-acetyltransferase [Gemmataceae bacterium]